MGSFHGLPSRLFHLCHWDFKDWNVFVRTSCKSFDISGSSRDSIQKVRLLIINGAWKSRELLETQRLGRVYVNFVVNLLGCLKSILLWISLIRFVLSFVTPMLKTSLCMWKKLFTTSILNKGNLSTPRVTMDFANRRVTWSKVRSKNLVNGSPVKSLLLRSALSLMNMGLLKIDTKVRKWFLIIGKRVRILNKMTPMSLLRF